MKSARTEAIQIARKCLSQSPLYLDTETTGTGQTDEIIEISIIDDEGSEIFHELVKPLGSVSSDARRVHRIDDEALSSAQRWMTVWPKVEAAISGRVVCIYNAEFDFRLLQQSHAKYKMRWFFPENTSFFCVMKLYAQFYGEWNNRTGGYRWQSLTDAGRQCAISLPNAHRATADCLLTRALLHHIADTFTQE